MDREIKVTKCGDMVASELNDRISIEFSPFEITNLKWIFNTRALSAKEYQEQGSERKMHNLFVTARGMWEKAREKKDE